MTSIVRKGFIYFTLVAMGGIFSLEAYASDVYRGNGHSF